MQSSLSVPQQYKMQGNQMSYQLQHQEQPLQMDQVPIPRVDLISKDFSTNNQLVDLSQMQNGLVQKFPQYHHSQQTSPQQMLKKRYKVNEPITDYTSVVYGFDQLSKMPKNLKVMIRIYKTQDEYQRQLKIFKTLRSPHVATLLDFWEDDGLGYIVLERGSYTVDHYLAEMQGKIDFETKKYILLDMISSWLFLYQYGFYCEFRPEDFMWFNGHWKIVNCQNICLFSEVLASPNDHIEFIYLDQEVVQKIINYEHSQVMHDPEVTVQTLGMMLLELFLLSPILANKSYDELIEDLRKGALMSFVSSEEDKSIFEILRHIVLQQKHENDEQHQLIDHINALINIWNNNEPATANEMKKNYGKFVKKHGAF